MSGTVVFDDLVGKEFGFYGADNHHFKLGRHVFEALEDPDDGYRSMLAAVPHCLPPPSKLIFFKRSLAKVRLEEVHGPTKSYVFKHHVEYDSRGYRLVDVKDGHVWLSFGTHCTDDYYPWFYFYYLPKAQTK